MVVQESMSLCVTSVTDNILPVGTASFASNRHLG